MKQPGPNRFQLRGNIKYLFVAFIIAHFTYPFSELSTAASAIYVVGYSLILALGAYVTAVTQRRMVVGLTMALVTLVTGVAWAFFSNDQVLNISLWVFYASIITNIILMIVALAEYIFMAKVVTQRVLIAGVTLYFLIGNLFTPIYLALNALILNFTEQAAFGIHTWEPVNGITWQRMYYLSFTTLTTLGFGDVTPVNPFVEPFVLAEAVVGVLYLASLMARLVSLYDSQRTS